MYSDLFSGAPGYDRYYSFVSASCGPFLWSSCFYITHQCFKRSYSTVALTACSAGLFVSRAWVTAHPQGASALSLLPTGGQCRGEGVCQH